MGGELSSARAAPFASALAALLLAVLLAPEELGDAGGRGADGDDQELRALAEELEEAAEGRRHGGRRAPALARAASAAAAAPAGARGHPLELRPLAGELGEPAEEPRLGGRRDAAAD